MLVVYGLDAKLKTFECERLHWNDSPSLPVSIHLHFTGGGASSLISINVPIGMAPFNLISNICLRQNIICQKNICQKINTKETKPKQGQWFDVRWFAETILFVNAT